MAFRALIEVSLFYLCLFCRSTSLGKLLFFRKQKAHVAELKFLTEHRTKLLAELQYKYRKLEQNDSLRLVISSHPHKLANAKQILDTKISPVKRNLILRVQQGGCNQCVEGLLKAFSRYGKNEGINLIILAKYTSDYALRSDIKSISDFPNVIVDNQHPVSLDRIPFTRPYIFELKKDDEIANLFFPDYQYQNHVETYIKNL